MLNYLLFLSMVHEYAYFYEYIWKSVYYVTRVTRTYIAGDFKLDMSGVALSMKCT